LNKTKVVKRFRVVIPFMLIQRWHSNWFC